MSCPMCVAGDDGRPAYAMNVRFENDSIIVGLSDGRTISTPVAWYSELSPKDDSDLVRCELLGRGSTLYWPTLKIAIPTEWIVNAVHR